MDILSYCVMIAGVLTVIVLLNLFRFSFKARKYGVKTVGTMVGYKFDYSASSFPTDKTKIPLHFWYPVFLINDNGNEVYVYSKRYVHLPVYKVGEKVKLEYLNTGNYDTRSMKLTYSEDPDEIFTLYEGYKVNILDIKHNFMLIIDILLVVFLVINSIFLK